MPLPKESLTVHGGCSCGAIRQVLSDHDAPSTRELIPSRYKVEIPALADRPHHPLSNAANQGGEVRLPMIAIDHCNDCRGATGAILPQWLCTPIAYVSASVLPRSELEGSEQPKTSQKGKESWSPAAEVFQPGPSSKDSYLTFHRSSKEVTRSFCGRCGTHLGYRHDGFTRMGFPDMLDIMLGSVDRKDLDADNLAPERHLWVGCGIEWVNEFASRGSGGLPKHPEFSIAEFIE